MTSRRSLWFPAAAALLALAVPASAHQRQAPPAATKQTATQWYLDYRKVFEKATSYDDLFPFMSERSRKKAEARSKDDRAKAFLLMKLLSGVGDVKIVKETVTPTGAVLDAEGIDPSDKSRMTGTITLVKEAGIWKWDGESWSTSREALHNPFLI